jgi:hypothetical protein
MELSPLTAARVAEELGVAALAGGNLFGRIAMHPALEGVCTPEDRGRVVNDAWRRYGTVNSLSLVAVVGGWVATRGQKREPAVTRAKDVAVAAVAATGVASAIAGVRFGKAAPGGAVPLESGSEAASGASPTQTRQKRALNALGGLSLASELALVGIQAALKRRY